MQRVYRKEHIYPGPFLKRMPDLIFETMNFEYSAINGITEDQVIENTWTASWERTGFHRLEGIFLACGSSIRKSKTKIVNAEVIDIVPTILHIFGLAIPDDMDGKVLRDIFDKSSDLAKRDIMYEKTGEKAYIEQKIKKLKTLGRI